jgi:hypothetical protein
MVQLPPNSSKQTIARAKPLLSWREAGLSECVKLFLLLLTMTSKHNLDHQQLANQPLL